MLIIDYLGEEHCASLNFFLPLLHRRGRMIKPGEVADHRFVVTVIAFADLHRCNLCQAHFQVPPEGVLVERLAAGLHVALRTKLSRR